MSTTTTNLPALTGFTTHYGVPVCAVGEDGDLIALGHHQPRYAFAAFRRYVRTEWDWDLAAETCGPRTLADRVGHEMFVVGTTCGNCGDDPDCGECSEIATYKWWLREANDADTDAFPVTTWR